jgi:XTP/dITP diphosphohydrolase
MRYALARMEGVTNRWATFRTVVVVTPRGELHTFNGDARGIILRESRCPPQPRMPYSSIFMPEGEELTWAEMTTEHENRISHRGKAFAQAKEFLQRTAA